MACCLSETDKASRWRAIRRENCRVKRIVKHCLAGLGLAAAIGAAAAGTSFGQGVVRAQYGDW